MLNSVSKSSYIINKCNIMIYKTKVNVKSIMLYGAETWKINIQHQKRISIEMDVNKSDLKEELD